MPYRDPAGWSEGQRYGDLWYFRGSQWFPLHPGTSGQVLQTQGNGAAPSWVAFKATGLNLSGQALGDVVVFDGSNWIRLGTANRGLLQSASAGTPTWTATGPNQGDMLTFDGTNWVRLGPGVANQVLLTQGAGANPAWGDLSGQRAVAWTGYTPQLAQNGNRTSTVTSARWYQIGKIVHVQVVIVCTQAGSISQTVSISLPVTAQAFPGTLGHAVGSGYWYAPALATIYAGVAVNNSTTTVAFLGGGGVGSNMGTLSPALALANNDELGFNAVYEAA